MARYFLFVFLSIVCLTACDRSESTLIAGDEQMATHKYITPEENGDTTVIYIGSAKDLQNALTLTAERQEQLLLQRGWRKEKLEETTASPILKGKRIIRTDTVYIPYYTNDYASDPSVYEIFNAKFSRSMVDSINKVVSPECRISSKKTYRCNWRLFSTYYNVEAGEQVSSRPSPLCALVPITKSKYVERGYSIYVYEFPGLKQVQMDSYQLVIICEKVRHKTRALDIEWPIRPKQTKKNVYSGYEFIYTVSKRL